MGARRSCSVAVIAHELDWVWRDMCKSCKQLPFRLHSANQCVRRTVQRSVRTLLRRICHCFREPTLAAVRPTTLAAGESPTCVWVSGLFTLVRRS